MIKSIEFNTHKNGIKNLLIMLINMFSFLWLLGIGIVETHPHPLNKAQKIKQRIHLVSAANFFILNFCTNMYCTIVCMYHHILSKWCKRYTFIYVHIFLTYLTLVLLIAVGITISITTWFLSSYSPIPILESWRSKSGCIGYLARFLVVPINKDKNWCIIKAENHQRFSFNETHKRRRHSINLGSVFLSSAQQNMNSCNCLKRRKIYRLCLLNYVLELLLIISTVSATMLHSATKNKYLGNLKLYNQFDNQNYEDICWTNLTSNCTSN